MKTKYDERVSENESTGEAAVKLFFMIIVVIVIAGAIYLST